MRPPAPPRRDRWLSLIEVADIMKLANPKRDERRRSVRRAVQRAEKRDDCRYTKRVGKCLYVSVSALETLLPYDAESFTRLGRSVADIAQIQREHGRQLNGIGSRVRVVEQKVKTLAETDRALLRASEAHGEALSLIRANIGPSATA
jgi:hypothetical protein